MITLSIDVNKLDKTKFFKGQKGTYCNLVLIETPDGQYGDFMVKQDSTKEERQSGVQMPILGNGKTFKKRDPFSAQPPKVAPIDPDEDEIPF